MRRALFVILMAATAATPVAAQAQDVDRTEGRAERHAERAQEHYRQMGERNEARAERRQEVQTQRVERQEAPRQQYQRVERVEAPVQQQQQQSWAGRRGGDGQRTQSWGGGDRQSTQSWGRGGQSQSWSGSGDRDAYRRQIEESRRASERSADQTVGGNYARQAERNQERYEQRVREDRRGDRSWSRDGRGDWNRDGRSDSYRGDRYSDRRGRTDWNRSWRNDSRYDWQRYRYANRNIFRGGAYYSPYRNYSYNRLSIGFILDSLFFSDRYRIADPWQYRLPPAPYGTEWVRYYDDVLLVDVYSGEVIDVIYDFFW